MTCTFFGHRDAPIEVMPKLKEKIEEMIVKNDVNMFLVGNQGNFDRYAYGILKELKNKYTQIEIRVVLAYYPDTNKAAQYIDCEDTIIPDGIEKTPKRFAISYRNKWMIERSEYVITYVVRSVGGAAKFAEEADKKKKYCINIAEKIFENRTAARAVPTK